MTPCFQAPFASPIGDVYVYADPLSKLLIKQVLLQAAGTYIYNNGWE